MPTLGQQGGALLLGCICTFIAGSSPAAAQTSALPAGWTNRDIGDPVIAGSAESAADTFTVRGAGADIGGTSDQFHFAYRASSGDVDVRLRITDLQATSPGAKAGLMIREAMTANSRNAFVYWSEDQRLAFQWRSRTARKTSQNGGGTAAAPVWVRLTRQGNQFRAYTSPTGTEWTLAGSATINMSADVYVGLAVTSQDPSRTATAAFSSLAFGSSTPPTLPGPWEAADIGNPALPGAASESGGTFTVKGSGEDIWNTSDQFQFVYQPVTGDTQIVAWIGSLEAADEWSKAGVMIRTELTGSAGHASMFATGSSGWAFQRRPAAEASSYHTGGSAGAAPGWVRLVREGNLFSAYQSQDGSHWTLVGSDTIPMPATIYAGLAVTSHNSTATATASFSNVAITAPTSTQNEPPTVSISAPSSGASFTAPANISITATAADVDGSVTRVDFLAGTQVVGSATANPFTTIWSNVPVGSYSLTAVAADNASATATSQPIVVTVVAAPTAPRPMTLYFVPSVDYATNVDWCTVEVRRAGDPLTATPIATRNLGKPAVAGGEIAVDITTLGSSLTVGSSYYAIVVAYGPGGSTPSSPSPVFTKQ